MAVASRNLGLFVFVIFAIGCGSDRQPPAAPALPAPSVPSNRGETDTAPSPIAPTENGTPSTARDSADLGPATGDGANPNALADAASGPSGNSAPEPPPSIGLPTVAQWTEWAASLRGDDSQRRSAAADSIAASIQPLDKSDQWRLLQHESASTRCCVAYFLLNRFQVDDPAAFVAWTGALSDEDPTVRHIALTAFKRLPAASVVPAVPQLADVLLSDREDAANRASIVRLLGKLKEKAAPATDTLIEVLHSDPDPAVRAAAAVAIPQVVAPEQAVAELSKALQADAEPSVRTVVVVRLGKLGPAAAPAVDALAAFVANKDPEMQRRAIDALLAIGKPSVPSLIECLNATDPAERRLAVFALGSLGTLAAEAVEPLKARLSDDDLEVRQMTEVALRSIETGR